MVEEGRRCVERVGQIGVTPALPGPAAHPHHSDGRILEQPGQCFDLPDVVACRRAQQLGVGRGDAGFVVLALVGEPVAQIHRAGQQVDRRDAVGQRMVDLADHGESAPGQPFGEMKLPQRTIAVQGVDATSPIT